jgi:hypothetical protein
VVFIICAIVYLIGAVVFWIFCQSDLQPWAKIEEPIILQSDNQSELSANEHAANVIATSFENEFFEVGLKD